MREHHPVQKEFVVETRATGREREVLNTSRDYLPPFSFTHCGMLKTCIQDNIGSFTPLSGAVVFLLGSTCLLVMTGHFQP